LETRCKKVEFSSRQGSGIFILPGMTKGLMRMGQELEYLDAYDASLRHIGVVERQEAHRKGYWHKTFHCWVLCERSDERTLVLQRRHTTKDTFPDKLDVSCAGHLLAGEGPEDGVRELAEELGIVVPFSELRSVGAYKEEFRSGDFYDCEIAQVYLYCTNLPLSAFQPELSEVSGLYEVSVNEVQRLILGEIQEVDGWGFIEEKDHGRREDRMRIRLQDIVDRQPDYYNPLFRMILNSPGTL
jgi:isopentenyldiphosphate isomerase